MASSETVIANLAISHLGNGKEIQNLETENSNEANACRRYYEICRDKVLQDFAWPFATKFVSLGLVEEDPTSEWAFSYRYPADCLSLRRILSGIRNDNRQSRIPYRVAQDETGALLYTDQQEAEVEYTVKVTDTNRFSPTFTLALSYLLAAHITPRLTGSDRFTIVPKLMELYFNELSIARSNAANEEQPEEEPQSEFIRAREEGSPFDQFGRFNF